MFRARAELLAQLSRGASADPQRRIVDWSASLWTVNTEQLFITGEGARTEQQWRMVIPNVQATASAGGVTQTRSAAGQYNGFCQQGGLEVLDRNGDWLAITPPPGALVCNIGDMLETATGGVYRSTPHRVLNRSDRYRVSMPFFFDPGFDARIVPLPGFVASDDSDTRWDKSKLHEFSGTYGDYLLGKVSKVFPELARKVV